MKSMAYALLLSVATAQAQTYKCVEQGATFYTDRPCRAAHPDSSAPEEKTAEQIQAEFDAEIAQKKEAEKQALATKAKQEEVQRVREAWLKVAIKSAPQRAATGAASLRSAMRDPDSFILEVARVIKDTATVCYVYRSKNGFGGYVRGLALLPATGYDVITDKARGFNELWHKECHMKDGTDMAAAIQRFAY